MILHILLAIIHLLLFIYLLWYTYNLCYYKPIISLMLLCCCTRFLYYSLYFNLYYIYFLILHITFTIFLLCTVSVHISLPCNCKFYWIHKGLSVTFVIVCCGVYICIECYENKKQTTSLSLFDLYSQYFKGNELCSDLRHNKS